MARTWSAVLARTGVPTGDGRILDPAGGSSRSLPLPLSWQRESDDGHGGSVVVGRIESMRFENGMVAATGSMLDSAEWSGEVMELLEAGVIGPSVDLDDVEYVMDEDERIVLTKWRVAGATLVSIPAFAEVSLTLDPEPVDPMENGAVEVTEAAPLFASATPEQFPPSDWFRKPDLDELTPLTVSDTGRVFGHIAGWETCHVGLPGCVTPPASETGYAYFHVSEQRTADGLVLPVGTLVAGPRHADAQAAFQAAQAHYDDPSAAVARVVAGEDEHGIWVAGWLLPGAADEALDVFRTSPVSGDWRRVGGSLELIAVCSVNAPGFPVPRARVAFSNGHQRTLVGSFGIRPVTEHVHRVGNPDEDGGVMDDWDNCRDPECPGPGQNEMAARARWAWAEVTEGTRHGVQ